ncbi:MAG: hypothetical protein DMG34_09500, partial [Acidobacteria bacterium]
MWKSVGNLSSGLCCHLLTGIGSCGGFSQLQLQQQEVLIFVLIRSSKNNLSLVVMMTAVNLWKAQQAQQPQVLAILVHCARECVYLGNSSTPEHGTHALRFSILALQQNFPSLLKRFTQRAVRLDLPYRVVATNIFRHFSGFGFSKAAIRKREFNIAIQHDAPVSVFCGRKSLLQGVHQSRDGAVQIF